VTSADIANSTLTWSSHYIDQTQSTPQNHSTVSELAARPLLVRRRTATEPGNQPGRTRGQQPLATGANTHWLNYLTSHTSHRQTQSKTHTREQQQAGRLQILLLFLIKLTLLFSRRILILLVLGHKVVHVRLSLCELHLIHTFPSVPVKESLAPEHGSELL
jgi:hypothetical protein